MEDRLSTDIAALEAELKDLLARMDAPCRQFLSIFAENVARWYREKALSSLRARADQAKQLGRDGIAALRAEIEQLASDAQRIVAEQLDVDRLWVHRDHSFDPLFTADLDEAQRTRLQKCVLNQDYKYKIAVDGTVSILADAQRRVLGRVGEILDRYELARRSRLDYLPIDDPDWRAADGRVHHLIYVRDLDSGLVCREPILAYDRLHEELLSVGKQLLAARERQARDAATRLWEESGGGSDSAPRAG
jgi:hypothetical protein